MSAMNAGDDPRCGKRESHEGHSVEYPAHEQQIEPILAADGNTPEILENIFPSERVRELPGDRECTAATDSKKECRRLLPETEQAAPTLAAVRVARRAPVRAGSAPP
jgi:hypothetical protein